MWCIMILDLCYSTKSPISTTFWLSYLGNYEITWWLLTKHRNQARQK